MRIVGGSLGGRRFSPPPAIPARPTTDLAREGLFNILINRLDFDGIAVLDLFAGTGGVSYEAVSRGAAVVTVVEQDAGMITFIKKTAAAFGIEAQLRIVRSDAVRFLLGAAGPYSLIFADPPYAMPRLKDLPALMLAPGLLAEGGIAVLEHDDRHSFEQHPHFLRAKAYGDTVFTFFSAAV